MPKFTKGHYEVVAAAINAAWRQQNLLPDRDYRAGVKFVEACTK